MAVVESVFFPAFTPNFLTFGQATKCYSLSILLFLGFAFLSISYLLDRSLRLLDHSRAVEESGTRSSDIFLNDRKDECHFRFLFHAFFNSCFSRRSTPSDAKNFTNALLQLVRTHSFLPSSSRPTRETRRSPPVAWQIPDGLDFFSTSSILTASILFSISLPRDLVSFPERERDIFGPAFRSLVFLSSIL